MDQRRARLHPLVEEVAGRQLGSLKIIYFVLAGLIVAILAVSLALGSPLAGAAPGGLGWLEAALAGLSLVLLGLVLPLARLRLLGLGFVQRADAATLVQAGLPEGVDPVIGRQALYLTRYSAACVISWGLCVAVGLYGLVASMMGADAWLAGAFFAAAVFGLLILPPDRRRLWAALEGLRP